MSTVAQPTGLTMGRTYAPVAPSIEATRHQATVVAEPSALEDKCIVAVTAQGGPSLVEVTMLLLHAGFRPIALTSVAGTIRATLPADVETAAITALTDGIVQLAAERQPSRRRWFARI